jgi:quercetin dioxygenase-like cupin family protein
MNIVRKAERQAKPGKFPGSQVRVVLCAENGAGSLTMGEAVYEPGATVPLHRHRVEEAFFIVEGSGTAFTEDEEVTLRSGDAMLAPAGQLHGFRNDSDAPLRLIYFNPNVHIWSEYPNHPDKGGDGI